MSLVFGQEMEELGQALLRGCERRSLESGCYVQETDALLGYMCLCDTHFCFATFSRAQFESGCLVQDTGALLGYLGLCDTHFALQRFVTSRLLLVCNPVLL